MIIYLQVGGNSAIRTLKLSQLSRGNLVLIHLAGKCVFHRPRWCLASTEVYEMPNHPFGEQLTLGVMLDLTVIFQGVSS